MQLASTTKLKRKPGLNPRFYHGTLVPLDNKPLFARGSLPTIHSSLTYAIWYIYWMSRLERADRPPSFYIYQLHRAERYLIPQGNGLFSVSEIGTIPYDDRNQGVLKDAPDLFSKGWDWDGKLTYLPAHYLQRVSASVVRQEVDLEEWLTLCNNMDETYPFRGVVSAQPDLGLQIPHFLRTEG